MAKKVKAANASWRTVARRANQATKKGHKGAAKRLSKLASQKRRGNQTIKSLAREAHKAGLAVQITSIPKAASPPYEPHNPPVRPGRGEIVGGADSRAAEIIVKLARKRGGTDAVQNEISQLRQEAHYQGCRQTDESATKRLIEVQQAMADRMVCGFIAEVDMAMKTHRGLPPEMVWMLNSYVVAKIVDALNKAGYRASGKT